MKHKSTFTIFSLMVMMMFGFTGLMAQDTSSDASYNSEGGFGIRLGGIISKQKFDEGNLAEDPESKFGADIAIMYSLPSGVWRSPKTSGLIPFGSRNATIPWPAISATAA